MDVASKQQKTLRNVLYYGLPVLAILMIATVLAAEMLGARKGLGALVTRGWQGSDMALVLVSVITIAIIGALLSLGLQKLEKVVCPWNN